MCASLYRQEAASAFETCQTVSYEQFGEIVAIRGEHDGVVARRSKDSTPAGLNRKRSL
jgi:hypothetical protein